MPIKKRKKSTTGKIARVDSITFEIVRHRLWAIADEMAMTLIKTAGNPSITEVHDFMVAIFTADSDIALGGWGGNRHVSCTAQACKAILARFQSDIHEGDIFLLNDPYVAAIHQQDVYVISPVHFKGRLVAWTGNFTHLPDIGGIDPGTSPRATEVFQEGLRIPGLKIADRGVIRQDVWETILNMTREPEMNALQLRAQIAANHTGKEKLQALIERIGVEPYQAIVAQMIRHSEEALRARLRQLPDGTWHTREYHDTKDRMYQAQLAMTKNADRLIFDFTGSSEQAPNFINCTYWGTRGGVFVAVSSMLGYGLPWNEGLLKPISITVPEGTLLNCKFPGPVSAGTTAGSRLATIAAWSTMSNMLATTERFAGEISALWSAGTTGLRISGTNRDNRYFVLTPFEGAGGGGARRFADGVDCAGSFNNPVHSIPNIETLERNAPVLYLFRRQLPDSGGLGTYRGGVSTEVAFCVHKAPKGMLKCVLSGSGREPAKSHGLFGGFPGCNTYVELRTGTGIQEALRTGMPLEIAALGGDIQKLPPQGLFEVQDKDIVYTRADGGGGFGDPLFRSPEKVLDDVRRGLVSVDQAAEQYGVVLYAGEAGIDKSATAKLRRTVRDGRLKAPAKTDATGPSQNWEEVITPVLFERTLGVTSCAFCRRPLCPVHEDWKNSALVQSRLLSSLGKLMTSTMFFLRTFSCPGCGTILDAEMTLPDDPPIASYAPDRAQTFSPS